MNRLRNLAIASSLAALVGCDATGYLPSDNGLTDKAKTNMAKKEKHTAPPAQPTSPPEQTYTGKVFRVIPPLKDNLGYTIIFKDGKCAYDLGVTPGVPEWQFPHIRQVRYGLAIGSMPRSRDVTITYQCTWTSMGCMDIHSMDVPAWKKK